MIRVAKLNFVESQPPRMLSYMECRSDPVFYLVEDVLKPEPAIDLDDLAGKVMLASARCLRDAWPAHYWRECERK